MTSVKYAVHSTPNSNPYPRPKGYLRQRELLSDYVPFSAATLWRKTRNGSFPPAIKISERVTVWNREAVEAWLISKEAA